MSEEKYRDIFQNSLVSLWEEDISELRSTIDDLKSKGIQDFRKYMDEHPEFAMQATEMIKVLDVNDATLKLYGAKKKDELLGSLDKIATQDSLSVFKKEIIAIAEGQKFIETEVAGQTLRGERLDLLIKLNIPAQSEKSKNMLVSIMDITERKQAEEKLRESEGQYRTLVESITDAIFMLDRDKHLAFVNSHGARWLQKRHEDVVGKEIGEFLPKRIAKQIIKNVDYVFERKVTITEERSVLFGSQLRHISTVLVPLTNPQGDVKSVMGIARDITHLKKIQERLRESEERFRAIAESAQDYIFIKDCSLKYIYVNPAMERLLQTSAAELVGQSDEEIFGEAAVSRTREVDSRVLEGEVVSEEDTRPVRGAPTSFHVIKVPLRDSSNQVMGLCGMPEI